MLLTIKCLYVFHQTLIIYGIDNLGFTFWIGIGIALYGLAYFLLHDTLVHQRTPLLKNINNNYFRAVICAHEDHHKGKKNFGFLLMFNWKYFYTENQNNYYNRQYAKY